MKVTVKSWNDSKGYGFVTDGVKDIFCHYTALYGEGFKTLRAGQEINVELIDGPKGLQVSVCHDWNVMFQGDLNERNRKALLECGHAYDDDCLCRLH